jgi:5'-nucleotidase
MRFKPIDDLGQCRILLSNDDGIASEGIVLLETLIKGICPDVWVVAPKEEKRGTGHALTPQKLKKMLGHHNIEDFPEDITEISARHYAVDGTPSDCIRIALNMILKDHYPDLIISGINNGRNIADDVTYSGTIGAAMEGIMYGIPSIAVSQLVERGTACHWQIVKKYLTNIIVKVCHTSCTADTLVNINFPNIDETKLKGIEVCRLGSRRFVKGTVENRHLSKKALLQDESKRQKKDFPADNVKIKDYITISALTVNLTDEDGLKELQRVFLQ